MSIQTPDPTSHRSGAPQHQTDPSNDQLRESAQLIVRSMAQFASAARARLRAESRRAGGPLALAQELAPVSLTGAAGLMLLAMILPIYHGISLLGLSGSEGTMIFVLGLILLGLAIAHTALCRRNPAVRLGVAILALLVGLLATVDSVGSLGYVQWSFGLFLLAVAGLASIASGVLVLMTSSSTQPQPTPPDSIQVPSREVHSRATAESSDTTPSR